MIEHAKSLMRAGDTFIAYCDGSSLGNPGPAGWAFALYRADGTSRAKSHGSISATNIEMELMAALNLLDRLVADDVGAIRTDSQHVVKGITEWRKGWEARGWKTSSKEPVSHRHMWERIFAYVDALPGVRFEWVKGHAGDVINEHVDNLARQEAEKSKRGVWSRPASDPPNVAPLIEQLRAEIAKVQNATNRDAMAEALDLIEQLSKP